MASKPVYRSSSRLSAGSDSSRSGSRGQGDVAVYPARCLPATSLPAARRPAISLMKQSGKVKRAPHWQARGRRWRRQNHEGRPQ